MKKTIAILISILILSFKTSEEKKLTVSLTLNQWQAIINVIDQSNAPHLEVQAAQNLLVSILNKQIDTTKKK